MNVLDENVPASQRQLLMSWRVRVRQIGVDVGRKGMLDDEVIPLLLTLRRPTFFSRDGGFYRPNHCHARYCLVYLDVEKNEVASFIWRMLRHPNLNTQSKRMGFVVRISRAGIWTRRQHQRGESRLTWPLAR